MWLAVTTACLISPCSSYQKDCPVIRMIASRMLVLGVGGSLPPSWAGRNFPQQLGQRGPSLQPSQPKTEGHVDGLPGLPRCVLDRTPPLDGPPPVLLPVC